MKSKSNARIIEEDERAKREAARRKFESATKELTLKLDCNTYGMLVSASIVHGTTPEEIAVHLIVENLCEWQNSDFILDE